jgi:hypothetical protein
MKAPRVRGVAAAGALALTLAACGGSGSNAGDADSDIASVAPSGITAKCGLANGRKASGNPILIGSPVASAPLPRPHTAGTSSGVMSASAALSPRHEHAVSARARTPAAAMPR